MMLIIEHLSTFSIIKNSKLDKFSPFFGIFLQNSLESSKKKNKFAPTLRGKLCHKNEHTNHRQYRL
jgi:hypothetical protein